MDEDLKHVILTRFNLAVRFECERKSTSSVPAVKPWLDVAYLEKRFDFFECFTFPALLAQTDRMFDWLVLFHRDTPLEFKRRICNYQTRMPQFIPLFFDDEDSINLGEVIKKYIADHYSCDKVITTRVDNDDVVHSTYIENIKKDLGGCEVNTILTYVNGIQYDIQKRNIIKYNYKENHFISLLDMKQRKHILMYNHAFINDNDEYVIKSVSTAVPLWGEIITENNYSNVMKWRFKGIGINYRIQVEYPMLTVRWKNKAEWVLYNVKCFFMVFVVRGRGLAVMLMKKIIK